ncbi:hypothetical protein BY458DRAFT_517406 [Sporodiniella umbellata]|nr:hypothetical protein BY458DRAFT_517406 [Sporodiniella umbellata]
MSDYNYSLTKEGAKSVPLYHHEQVPFQSFYRPTNTPSHHVNHNNNPQHTTVSPLLNNSPMKTNDHTNHSTNPASGDLQDIIYSYQTQPELLKLILSSKLEEDKRRAEEAKLKAKELDLLLIQQQQQQQQHHHGMPLSHAASGQYPPNEVTPPDMGSLFQPANNGQPFTLAGTTTPDNRLYSNPRRTSLDAILSAPLLPQQPQRMHARRSSHLDSSFTADSDELEQHTSAFSPLSTSTPVSASSLLPMDSYHSAVVMGSLQPTKHEEERARQRYTPKPRRRREMQAITKIVETRDYPYMDGYFWKNNGNTVQKKTGNKSVYYKCSNSNKGCPVNKTVTWKSNEEYLIKYRGEHLLECNKVQRIVDI